MCCMRRLILAALFLALSSPAWANEIRGTCFVTFSATSTLHDFTGTVRSEPFAVALSGKGTGERTIQIVEVSVPVNEIDTANEKRDKELREMFQSDSFPSIRGVVRNIHPYEIWQEMRSSKSRETTLLLTLKIRDIEQNIESRLANLREYGEQISFDMEFPVSLKAYGLKPPSLFFGLVRVGDTVTVKITFDLEGNPDEIFGRKH